METRRQKLRAAVIICFVIFVFISLIYYRIQAYSFAPSLKQPDLIGLSFWLIPIVYIVDYFSHAWSCLLFAFVFAGIIYEFIPKEWINQNMRSSRIKGYLIAACIAPFFTVCSCTMVPLFAGFVYAGAGIGPAIVFLLMAPAANFMTLLLTGEMIGWDIALVRLGAAFVTALIAGLLIAYSRWGRAVEEKYTIKLSGTPAAIELIKPPLDERLWSALKFSWHLVKQIMPFFLIGLVAVSYFVAYVPEDLIAPYLVGIQGVLIASVIGGPLYTPTLVEIVVGKALLDIGMSRGALISWLMGQPYDIPNMVATSRITGWKVVVLYALIALGFSVLFGLLYSIATGWI